MPTNKNAFTRYKFLDDLLSDRHHYYDIHDLTELCNQRLIDAGFYEVTQQCIEKDLNYLEYSPFYADIERCRRMGKNCIRYADPTFSIFSQEMSEEERQLLREVLSTLGQFEGLNHFEWLEKYMMQLVQIMSKVTELTNEYKERVNSKKIEDKSNFSTQYH
ncbi:MAG: hypothetical protein IKG96_09690 [Bacteroidaceae bacterium]|nr:hypothetical protein [Bacteroidaceae bacterium]